MAARRDDVDDLQRDISHTRAEMHETLDAIQDKLNPQRLRHQAQEAIREATIGRAKDTMSKAVNRAEDAVSSARETAMDAGGSMIDTIRENPFPAALAGIGIGWLFMNRVSRPESRYPQFRSRYATERYVGPYGNYYGEEGRTSEDIRGRVQETIGQAQETAGDIAGKAQETVGEVTDQVQERMGYMARRTRYEYGRVEDRFQESLDTNPLAIGAVALAAGAAAAMLLPSTLQERQFMGEARDNLMGQVQSAAKETMDKVERVAERVQDTAKKEAREEGLAE